MFNKRDPLGNRSVTVEIRKLKARDEAKKCAQMMTASEPWVLKQDLKASLDIVIDPSREVYLALVGNRISGFVILDMKPLFIPTRESRVEVKLPAGYIQTVCVAKEFRNRGIGSQLISFAEGRILRKVQNVCICVSPFSPDGRRLYERLGYEMIDQLADGDIFMTKTLVGT